MSRLCSQCGNNGHNCRTCTEASGAGGVAGHDYGSGAGNGIMLFGVRLMEGGSFRKSASMNSLAHYEQPQDDVAAAGYVSDYVFHVSDRSRERRRGVAWTEEEHKLFLLGLQKVGKGDWRGISRNFVKTRTPTQVASHAQKYFLRRTNHNRRRRRSSLFDITTDAYMVSTIEEDQIHQETTSQPHINNHLKGFPVSNFPVVLPVTGDNYVDNPFCPVPIPPVPPLSKMGNLNLNYTPTVDPLPLSLKLSPSPSLSPSDQNSTPARHVSAFQAMSGSFNNSNNSEDSIISVA